MKNHTKGEWIIDRHPEIDSSGRAVYRVSTNSRPTKEEIKANAQLIAEAGTVANETGMTPREMQEAYSLNMANVKLLKKEQARLKQQNEDLKEALGNIKPEPSKNFQTQLGEIIYLRRFIETIKIKSEKALSGEESRNQKLNDQLSKLKKSSEKLLHYHLCEQEGMQSGQPTSIQWMEAVDKLSEALKSIES